MSVLHRVAALGLSVLGAVSAQAAPDTTPVKSRVVVLTDIGNEPDDAESFVRFLLYSNEMDVEGLIATTSTWQRVRVQPQLLRDRIAAYAQVLPHLRRHAAGYPDANALQSVVRSGSAVYGMKAVGEGKDTDGSRLIVDVVDRRDDRPVYIPAWGGVADLAQALWTVRRTRTPEQVAAFVAKLRVYSISDQDDCGPWIRQNFPKLFWIASVHGWGQYGLAAWTGISGDLARPTKWPAAETVTNPWLESNIRRGPLGRLYPPHAFLMEGDTPSFLGLIRNGLNDPEHPEWGGWGGRYTPAYEGAGHRADTQDRFTDGNGTTWASNQATIFRWREAFQNDFAARIGWTLTPDVKQANHNPDVVLNGQRGSMAVRITAKAGAAIRLSARGTGDRDGQSLTYRWWQYAEPSGHPGINAPSLTIKGADTMDASIVVQPFRPTAENVPIPDEPLAYHVILEVTDSGTPKLTTYRRAIISVAP